MIKAYCITLLSLIGMYGNELCAQGKITINNEPIEIGYITSIRSEILNEERYVYVSLPAGYDTLTSNIPVLYVLDAEYRFNIAQSIQSYFNITTRIPKAILIGIANPSREARERDYLPASYGGKAHHFMEFLEKELFPFVAENFKASETKYLAGHSHGGVFAVHTLLNKSALFEGYIAIDPSLKFIYDESSSTLSQDLSTKKLYLASSDVAYGFLEDVKADMQADFTTFKNHLVRNKSKNNLSLKIDHIKDDHGNSYIQGFSRGLRYIFGWRFE